MQDELKRMAALAALAYVEAGTVIGVGSGSTASIFASELAAAGTQVKAAVAASEKTRSLLEASGVPVVGLAAELLPLPLYIDGADAVDGEFNLIKGGGGAHTREKVIAVASTTFVCIVDETKLVPSLDAVPLPVEVVPMAVRLVERELRRMGGATTVREDYETENGNVLVEVVGLDMTDPEGLECEIDCIPGVVECGIFASRRPDVVLVGTQSGLRTLQAAEE